VQDRWCHPASGRIYNLEFNPPKTPVKRRAIVLPYSGYAAIALLFGECSHTNARTCTCTTLPCSLMHTHTRTSHLLVIILFSSIQLQKLKCVTSSTPSPQSHILTLTYSKPHAAFIFSLTTSCYDCLAFLQGIDDETGEPLIQRADDKVSEIIAPPPIPVATPVPRCPAVVARYWPSILIPLVLFVHV